MVLFTVLVVLNFHGLQILQFVYFICVKLIVHQLYLNKLLKETLCLIHFCTAYTRIKFLSQGCFGKNFILILDYTIEMYPWVTLLVFSCSVMSSSLWPRGLQCTRLPCPSLSPRVYSNSCPLSQWCLSTISSSLGPFSSCPQSSPASGSVPMSCLFISGSQSIGASASASVLPMNIQGWFPLALTGLISLLSKGLTGVFSSTTIRKRQFFSTQPPLRSYSHISTRLPEKQ